MDLEPDTLLLKSPWVTRHIDRLKRVANVRNVFSQMLQSFRIRLQARSTKEEFDSFVSVEEITYVSQTYMKTYTILIHAGMKRKAKNVCAMLFHIFRTHYALVLQVTKKIIPSHRCLDFNNNNDITTIRPVIHALQDHAKKCHVCVPPFGFIH